MLQHEQYGVCMPGGVDSLVHARSVLEDTIRSDPSLGAWLAVDIDFENAFPSLEWSAIESAVGELFPNLLPWLRWCHDEADIELPCGLSL